MASAISVSLFGWSPKCENAKIDNFEWDSNKIENVVSKDVSLTEKDDLSNSSETARKQISICLELDDENSFTHTNALEKVLDPQNTVLEYPVAQLFQNIEIITIHLLYLESRKILGLCYENSE